MTIREDFHKVGIHSITRVAAQAALLLYDKYIGTMEESDVYKIAVGMFDLLHVARFVH